MRGFAPASWSDIPPGSRRALRCGCVGGGYARGRTVGVGAGAVNRTRPTVGDGADDRIAAMPSVHLIVPDLFLPADIAAEVCKDLRLPALERMLARGASTSSARTGEGVSLEEYLCGLFGVSCEAGAPIAPISAAFDGLGEGCWLRADPVHLRLQRDRLILLPEVEVKADEAVQLCAALNEHFTGQGMVFFAPHPQRWYMRLDRLPDIETVPLSQAAGRNVRDLLPKGAEAAHWHRVFNEIQMLLHSHPANDAREARGELPVNSLWLWGGGCDTLLAKPADCGSNREAIAYAPNNRNAAHFGCGCNSAEPLQKNYGSVSSDEVLAGMFAAAAGATFAGWPEQWRGEANGSGQLLVWTGLRSALRRGDLEGWRAALQGFEVGYAQPLWRALRAGKIARLQVDILGEDRARRLSLTRADAWAFWRRAQYSMV